MIAWSKIAIKSHTPLENPGHDTPSASLHIQKYFLVFPAARRSQPHYRHTNDYITTDFTVKQPCKYMYVHSAPMATNHIQFHLKF